MLSGIVKIGVIIAVLVGAVIAAIHLFPYLLIILAIFGIVKLFQALKGPRNPPPPTRWF